MTAGPKIPYVIAEIGSVHDGSFGNACRLLEVAADCGADAVKFQTHIAEAETLLDAPSPSYFSAEPRAEYFRRTGFSVDQWGRLAELAKKRKVDFLSSPFSLEAVDLLERVGVSAYKVPSGEVSNLPLMEYIARTKKPVLLSSGMSNWHELDAAVATLRPSCALTVLQCTSVYPCPPEQVGLNIMMEMRERYDVPVGLSDHTLGFAAAIAAVTLGATVVEKHFTFSKLMYGSDAKHSMDPDNFRILCDELKFAGRMMAAPVEKDDLSSVMEMKRIFEKSIVAAADLAEGTEIQLQHFAFKKPGDGIPAARYREYIGRRLVRSLPQDHKFGEEDFA
ncbi:N-acetylneuraminate synthase family protein [Bradyrhizobium sp. WYCCWR 13023]|uniref:N-acetylneuraminate synthase family protein n=1 Tax=Bradyrhizobium zhengyangense TaxID=2911009 RepID=A0A9X1RHJ9_9BRAD|nr:N-acetylneuraminate synthase family protein [Bradyrhizobium zhengyangense]MCG2630714.1 N-acetylneuraminate synthase family protein [Bradyrhizobium zhengyangense]